MTITNATIGSDFAVIAADTFAINIDGEGGLGEATKVGVLPHLNMLVATTGTWGPLETVQAMLRSAKGVGTPLMAVLDAIPGIARPINSAFGNPHIRLIAVAYPEDEQRIVAQYWDSQENFEPRDVGMTHVYSPDYDMGDPDYPRLQELSRPAVQDESLEEFHRLLARNQYRSFRAGEQRADFTMGGRLFLHRIDANGISIKKLMEFPSDQTG